MSGILKRVCGVELKDKAEEDCFHFEEPGVEDFTNAQLAGMGVIAAVLGAFIAWLANRFGSGGGSGGGGSSSGGTEAVAKEIAAKADVTTSSIATAKGLPTKPISLPPSVAKSINSQTAGMSLTASVTALTEQGKQTPAKNGIPQITQNDLWSAVIEAKVLSLIDNFKLTASMGKGKAEITPFAIAVALLDRSTAIAQYETYKRRESGGLGRLESILKGNHWTSGTVRPDDLGDYIYALSFLAGKPVLVKGEYNRALIEKTKKAIHTSCAAIRELAPVADDPRTFADAATKLVESIKSLEYYNINQVTVVEGDNGDSGNFYTATTGTDLAKDFLSGKDPCDEVLELKASYNEFIEAIKELESKVVVDGNDVDPEVARKLRGVSAAIADKLKGVSKSLVDIDRFIAVAKTNQAKISVYMDKLDHACKLYVKYADSKDMVDVYGGFEKLIQGTYFCK